MDFLTALWAPILLSAVFVFLVSSIIHMVLKYHANDFKKVPNEDAVQAALRPFNITPGDYMLPRADSMKDCKTPEFMEKLNKGPIAVMTVLQNGQMKMGQSLLLWFLFSVLVSCFSAYITWHAVPVGGSYLSVFRFIGTTAFMGYGLALIQSSIWYGRSWSTVFKLLFDALLYALVTAGTFGWLWPKM